MPRVKIPHGPMGDKCKRNHVDWEQPWLVGSGSHRRCYVCHMAFGKRRYYVAPNWGGNKVVASPGKEEHDTWTREELMRFRYPEEAA